MQVLTTLNFGSFPGKIIFSSGYTFKDICKELKKQKCGEWLTAFKTTEYLFTKDCAGFSSTRCIEVDGKEYEYHFICLRDEFDFSDKHHTTLSHEVIHCCTFHLSNMLD